MFWKQPRQIPTRYARDSRWISRKLLLAGIFFRVGRRVPPVSGACISVDPSKRSGQACIRDLRLTVKDILEYLAGGMSENEILIEFPDLEKEDFAAVYAYAASELAGSHQ